MISNLTSMTGSFEGEKRDRMDQGAFAEMKGSKSLMHKTFSHTEAISPDEYFLNYGPRNTLNNTNDRMRSNAQQTVSNSIYKTMNLTKIVGADLTNTKNLDTAQLRNAVNLIDTNDTNKVFYNTGGLQLKNSLSGQKSQGH